MSDQQIIDVHCHLFNGSYALAELTSASWNLLKGTYPRPRGEELAKPRSFGQAQGVTAFAAYVARLLDVVLSDPAGNWATQTDSLARSQLKGRELISVPLMMDIYYALDDNHRASRDSRERDDAPRAVQPFTIPSAEEAAFAAHLTKVRDLVARQLDRRAQASPRALETTGAARERLDEAVAQLHHRFLDAREIAPRGGDPGIELSPGYLDHMEELEELARANPGRVLPFLALDPRRWGIHQLMELKLDQGRGLFKGVKLYTPQGYLPTHPELIPVYDYCARHDIPIIVHCSLGGFENFRSQNWVESWTAPPHWESFTKVRHSRSGYYADPEKWIPVLERWPTLRLDFGHFGGSLAGNPGTVNGPWLDTIHRLMRQYPNVYADLSYISNPRRQAQTLAIIRQSDILPQRVMFGTDFIMVAMDRELGGLSQYFSNYADLEEALLVDNARRFLNLV